MGFILLGCLAFLIAYFYDLAALKNAAYLKQAIGLTFVSLFGFSLLMVCLRAERLPLPHWLFLAGLAAWPIHFPSHLLSPSRIPYQADLCCDQCGKVGRIDVLVGNCTYTRHGPCCGRERLSRPS